MSVKWAAATGIAVAKAAQNLPQTATATLFTVSGGAVLVNALLGVVSTALGATATNLSVGTAVAGDAGTTIIAATAVASKAAGTLIVPQAGTNGAPAAAPFLGNAAFVGNTPFETSPFFVSANITWTTSANDTGQMKWYCWYTPIDAGASVS